MRRVFSSSRYGDNGRVIPGFNAAGAPTVEFLAGYEAFLFRHGFHSFTWVYEPYRDFEERGRSFGNLWKTSLEGKKKTTCGKQCQRPLGHEFIKRTR